MFCRNYLGLMKSRLSYPTNGTLKVVKSPGMAQRWASSSESGAVLARPTPDHLGLFKVALTVVPGMYIGATISKTCATFLEENDIFVPADDDDDDD